MIAKSDISDTALDLLHPDAPFEMIAKSDISDTRGIAVRESRLFEMIAKSDISDTVLFILRPPLCLR